MTSVRTGFPNLDGFIGGFQPADMLLLASPPLRENISLALSIVLNVAATSHHRVGIFTPAMNKNRLVQRLLALSTGIDLYRLSTGELTSDEYNHLAVRARILSHAKIWINDSVDLSVLQFQQQIQAMVKAYNITFLLINNIHCLRVRNTNYYHTLQIPEMQETSEMVKMLAKALNTPILVVVPHATLNANRYAATEQVEDVQKKDADHVLFLYRENVSQGVIQEKHSLITPLRIVSHRNGFVTDIALLSQSQQSASPDEAHASPLTPQGDICAS